MNHQDVVLEHLIQQIRQRFSDLCDEAATMTAPAAYDPKELEHRLPWTRRVVGRKLDQQRDELERRLTAAMDAGRKLEQQRDELRHKADRIEEAFNAEIANARHWQSQAEYWKGQAEHWHAQATIAKKGQGAAHKQAEKLRAELATAHNNNTTYQGRVKSLEQGVDSRDTTIEGLEKQAEKLCAELALANELVAGRDKSIATLQRAVDVAETQVRARDFTIEGLEKQIADLGHRLDEARREHNPECEHTYFYELGNHFARCVNCGHTIPAAEFTQRHGCGPYTENAVLKEDC